MVPRTEIVFDESRQDAAQAYVAGAAPGFSRIPVVGENLDDVVGVAYLKDLVRRTYSQRGDSGRGPAGSDGVMRPA